MQSDLMARVQGFRDDMQRLGPEWQRDAAKTQSMFRHLSELLHYTTELKWQDHRQMAAWYRERAGAADALLQHGISSPNEAVDGKTYWTMAAIRDWKESAQLELPQNKDIAIQCWFQCARLSEQLHQYVRIRQRWFLIFVFITLLHVIDPKRRFAFSTR